MALKGSHCKWQALLSRESRKAPERRAAGTSLAGRDTVSFSHFLVKFTLICGEGRRSPPWACFFVEGLRYYDSGKDNTTPYMFYIRRKVFRTDTMLRCSIRARPSHVRAEHVKMDSYNLLFYPNPNNTLLSPCATTPTYKLSLVFGTDKPF
jgi:hypothetical protein